MQYPKQTDNYDVDIFNSNFRDLASQILSLDTAKLDKTDAQGLFRDVSFNRNNGTIVFTLYDGSTKTIDTLLEKLAVNFDFDRETQRLIVTLDDGTEKYVDLSAFVSQYEFTDSDTAVWVLGDSGEVSVKIREGSIEEKHLRPDYLADLRAEAEKALASSREAAESQRSAEESEAGAVAGAASSAESAGNAEAAAGAALRAKEAALEAAEAARDSANRSQSYAVGTGGARPDESTHSAKYYYEQSRLIAEGLGGALVPMGTVDFENLPAVEDASSGWMYNVSDQFTTTENFVEGAGITVPAGSNIYRTAEGKWDVLAGSPVAAVNGKTGDIVLGSADVGALPDTTKYAASETAGGDAKYAKYLRGFFSGLDTNSGIEPSGDANIISYTRGTSGVYGIDDGAEFVQSYNPSFMYQMYGDYRSGQLATRGKSGGTWGPWRKQLDSENYAGLTPKLAPQAHYYSTDARQQGYYKISINADTSWMLSCMVMLYQGYNAYVILVSGYQYMDRHWFMPKADLVAVTEGINSISVTFGYDGMGKLWFAVPSGNYTGLTVCNINNGYEQVEGWADKISIKYEESLSGTVQAEKTAYAPTKSPEVRSIRKVASLPSDASGHPDTLYMIVG